MYTSTCSSRLNVHKTYILLQPCAGNCQGSYTKAHGQTPHHVWPPHPRRPAQLSSLQVSVRIDTERVNNPYRFVKVGRLCDLGITCSWASRRQIRGAGPIPAKCDIEDDDVILEMRDDITVFRRQVGHGLTPRRRIWDQIGDIVGDRWTREEPNADPAVIPLHDINTPANLL